MTPSTNGASTTDDPPTDGPPTDRAQSPWQQMQAATQQAWIGARSRGADVPTLIGCSGGADSVALVRILTEIWRAERVVGRLAAPLWVAHFNHGLRGAESDADAQFVSDLAKRLELKFVCERATLSAAAAPIEDEASLRQSRRDFFQRTAQRLGCRYVAVAHSSDDQVETLLHHFLRGAGPAGLGGIPTSSSLGIDVVLRRPMLHISRDLIRSGLSEIGQTWREDASNQQSKYTRNWLRNEVLPLIKQRFPQAPVSIAKAGQLQMETNAMIQTWASRWLDECSSFGDRDWMVHLNTLCLDGNSHNDGPAGWSTQRPIVIAAAQLAWDRMGWPRRDMALGHWRRLSDWICVPGSIDISNNHWPGGIRLERIDDQLRLTGPKVAH